MFTNKNRIIFALAFFAGLSIVAADGETGVFRWATDGSNFGHDKQAHFCAGFGFYFFFVHYKVSKLWAVFIGLIMGLMLEIKDSFMPHDAFGWWGGDGFSYYDLAYDAIGLLDGLVTELLIPPSFVKSLFE